MNKYMEVAANLARENLKTNNGGPFGACIVKDGKIIGKGANMVLGTNDPTAHAEVVAIRDACKNINSYDLTGCELYTTSYPCPMCLSAIIWANIKMVYYGNAMEEADDIGFRDEYIYNYIKGINKDTIKLETMDREETIKLFNEYKEKIDKTIC